MERDDRRRGAPAATSDPCNVSDFPNEIVPLEKRHARVAAELHRTAITTGFLSSLGSAFLGQLYKAVPSCSVGFGFVWEGSSGEVLGMVSCAESTGRLYRQCLKRRGLLMALTLLKHVLRPSAISRMMETLRYPSQAAEDLPAAEVLSVAVSENARGQGIGKALMNAAHDEFRRRGIDRVRVAVGGNNRAAKAFYRACGYDLVAERAHHGSPMSIFAISFSEASE